MRDVNLTIDLMRAWADIPVAAGFRAGISLLPAGTMRLSSRHSLPYRARILRAAGIAESRVYGARQVHSKAVLVVDGLAPDSVAEQEADALASAGAEPVLTITVADCLPVFLVDRARGAFALAHSGWKGTGITAEALSVMRARFGTDPRDVAATVGPGIGACCYRVPEERAASFGAAFGAQCVVRGSDGAPRLDLREANLGLLRAAGVTDLTVVTDCTCCTPALGSFRRQGSTEYTLMLAWIRRG